MTALRMLDAPAPKTRGAPAIEVGGLMKTFGAVTALSDLSFEVPFGKVTGFLGPNGAGKSTTLRIILGLVAPTSGAATVLGRAYRNLEHPTSTVGAVLETQSFNPLRSGRNHLRVIAAASGLPNDRVDEVLELVDLTGAAHRKAGKYSLGMRQRLGLAAAMLGRPRILILDEPANGLDPQGIRWLREFLTDFAERGNAVLVSSHQLSEIEQMAHEVILINRGRLIRQGRINDLTEGGAVIVEAAEARRLAAALEAADFAFQWTGRSRLTVRDATPEGVGRVAFDAGVALHGLARAPASLEQAFLDMTQEELK